MSVSLKMLPRHFYRPTGSSDPLRLYYWPVLGRLYRRRLEMCLEECRGGKRVLEVGFGSGVSFLNLTDVYGEVHGIDLEADVEETEARFRRAGVWTCLRRGNVLDLPYANNFFDTVVLVSVLEHLKPEGLSQAAQEIYRVLRPGGQVVYGVPVERPLMVLAFRLLGSDIHEHHFSTENDIRRAFETVFRMNRLRTLKGAAGMAGKVYEVAHLVKPESICEPPIP